MCQERLAQAVKERTAYWKQRGKRKAIREGDSNTSFFHAHATQRLRRNAIKLVEVEGVQLTAHDGKVTALTNYFKQVLGTPGDSCFGFDLMDLYQSRPQASSRMDAPFTETEALQAVRSMNRCSAPGPDGFGPSFYTAAWNTVKREVLRFLQHFHSGSCQLERVNRSYMVLIPKKPGAVAVDSFRPICLQNCNVKIAGKLLTTRLQQEIASLIDLDQTGFLKGRTIAENFVYAAELLQVCHKRAVPTLVLKLDFAKAFDTVNWEGLLTILEARGFSSQWRGWVETLLCTSRTAVLVNGCPGPWITCRRGLRQGDPMSPYLFLLVADVLQALIKKRCNGTQPPR